MESQSLTGLEPKVVGTARCAVTARKAGGIVRVRSLDHPFPANPPKIPSHPYRPSRETQK